MINPFYIRYLSAANVEIKGPNLNTYPATSTSVARDIRQLHQGQIIKALVTEINNNKTVFDLIEPKLTIQLEATGKSSFKLGQLVSFKVISAEPPLSLNVLTTNTNIQKNPQSITNAALRMILPKQPSMNQLLSNLEYLSNPKPKLNELFPQQILDLSRAAFQRLSNINDIKTANGIKSALENSGLFLEQQLKNSVLGKNNSITTDTRIALLRLAESIRSNIKESEVILNKTTINKERLNNSNSQHNSNENTKNQYLNKNYQHWNTKYHDLNLTNLKRLATNLPLIQHPNSALHELLRNIESSLAKIQYNQLQHFVTDEQSKTNWFFDVPIRREDGSDIFHFAFSQEAQKNDKNSQNEWSVVLSFNLEKLGDVNIQIYLRNSKIGATVWAKNNNTYELFKNHLTALKLQMEKSGIEVSNIRCNKGELQQSSPTKNQNILDEEV